MKRVKLFTSNPFSQNKWWWMMPMLLILAFGILIEFAVGYARSPFIATTAFLVTSLYLVAVYSLVTSSADIARNDNIRLVVGRLATSIPAGPFLIALLRRTKHRFALTPPFGWVRFGSFNCTQPISTEFGIERGQPVDRLYIESFLAACAADITGSVLEFGDRAYTRKFGGNKVTQSDVWDVTKENGVATIIGDLPTASHVPSEAFDCIVCTQMLGMVYDLKAAVKTIHRILKPGGVLLLTVGGISRIGRYDWQHYGNYWRFTSLSISRLLEECFSATNIKIDTYGNVYAAIAFLEGVAVEELEKNKLQDRDIHYQVLITARAVKEESV